MVTVSACPRKPSLNKRSDNLIDVSGAVLEEGVLPRDQVAIQNDEPGLLDFENAIHDVNGPFVLLRTPLFPSIWEWLEEISECSLEGEGRTLSKMQVFKYAYLKCPILTKTEPFGDSAVHRLSCWQHDAQQHKGKEYGSKNDT